MPPKEAAARIKINKLLEAAGWRFLPQDGAPANICLETHVKLKSSDLDALGANFEQTSAGFIDFLLLDDQGFPLIVLEAKAEDKEPLVGKEQARKYARNQNCRFVILSNGNLHYFWDLEHGNPNLITAFPSPTSVTGYQHFQPNPGALVAEEVHDDYIVRSQRPGYAAEAAWKNPAERDAFIAANSLRFLRAYQVKAVAALQRAAAAGKDRFLFEMATGTGKTLVAAAIIKLFLRTRNARRVLFLVDRLELEDQGKKALALAFGGDYTVVIYKENRDDWRHADVVISTVQSLLFNNKYLQLFSPTDFDLVISDEAHRTIGGNARAVFDYFVGAKLGLTATPRDYLKHFDSGHDPNSQRELERRILLDTYRTFACDDGQPTFRYSLLDGVKDGYLINPTVVDARTAITTQLLSEHGFVVTFTDNAGDDQQAAFTQREFEKRFISTRTNRLFCHTFLAHALRDPVSGEIGKAIIFAVSQSHAAKLTQILNELADRLFPGKYQSDFAVQVTSQVADAQQFALNFANNKLLGQGNFIPNYRTSKARVCVTVGMMTTGYDCPDILNLGLFRPIFSPTDFIQIKGRGTRRHNFLADLHDDARAEAVLHPQKSAYKLFDFFANCEYFEQGFKYDEVLALPKPQPHTTNGPGPDPDPADPVATLDAYEYTGGDALESLHEQTIGIGGMKIDRMYFEQFGDDVRADATVAQAVAAEQWEQAADHVARELLNKPEAFYTLEKLRKAVGADRRLSLREILELAFGRILHVKSKGELIDEEFAKFMADAQTRNPAEAAALLAIKTFFSAYLTDANVRRVVDSRQYAELATNPSFTQSDLRAVPSTYRTLVPEYIKDYVPLNQFAN